MQSPVDPPANVIAEAIALANKSPCAKSKRGVVIWEPGTNGGILLSGGHNAPPFGFPCDGSAACRANCNKLCEHAEQEALRVLTIHPIPGVELELLHVKTVDGQLVPSGGPSCWQCSRSIARDTRIAGVWLYHVDGWRRYEPAEFHELTLAACEDEFRGDS